MAAPGASSSPRGEHVIDLTTTIRIDRKANPLDALSYEERMRLLVRVLCELVAYGEHEPAAS